MYVDPMGFDDLPEGVARPGFFRGVATVVTKLLNVVQPDLAFFGQKDALQCVLVKRLVEVGVRELPFAGYVPCLAINNRTRMSLSRPAGIM